MKNTGGSRLPSRLRGPSVCGLRGLASMASSTSLQLVHDRPGQASLSLPPPPLVFADALIARQAMSNGRLDFFKTLECRFMCQCMFNAAVQRLSPAQSSIAGNPSLPSAHLRCFYSMFCHNVARMSSRNGYGPLNTHLSV